MTRLQIVLAAYFHQDWPDEFGSPEAAAAAFVERAERADIEAALEELLRATTDEQSAHRLLSGSPGFAINLSGMGMTAIEWLHWFGEILRAALIQERH